MNSRQRMVLWMGLLVIVVMGVYPPWAFRYGEIWLGRRYALITEPPSYGSFPGPLATIDANQLGVQWAAVILTRVDAAEKRIRSLLNRLHGKYSRVQN